MEPLANMLKCNIAIISRYWGKMTQKRIGMHHLRPSNTKIFWLRTPIPPARNTTLESSFSNPHASPIELGITHFSDFLVKTHSDPCLWVFLSTPFLRLLIVALHATYNCRTWSTNIVPCWHPDATEDLIVLLQIHPTIISITELVKIEHIRAVLRWNENTCNVCNVWYDISKERHQNSSEIPDIWNLNLFTLMSVSIVLSQYKGPY